MIIGVTQRRISARIPADFPLSNLMMLLETEAVSPELTLRFELYAFWNRSGFVRPGTRQVKSTLHFESTVMELSPLIRALIRASDRPFVSVSALGGAGSPSLKFFRRTSSPDGARPTDE